MNNLIINGIDHSRFDLEWAKRGGVVISIIDNPPTKRMIEKVMEWAKRCGVVISIIDNPPTKRMIGKVIGDEFFESKHFCADEWISDSQDRVITRKLNLFRMATPSECAAAGIEYIEPPIDADMQKHK